MAGFPSRNEQIEDALRDHAGRLRNLEGLPACSCVWVYDQAATPAKLSAALQEIDTIAGPGLYSTGGFVLDLSARFSSLLFLSLVTEVGGAWPAGFVEVLRDTPTAGKATILVRDVAGVEIAPAVDLSTTLWRYLAIGAP